MIDGELTISVHVRMNEKAYDAAYVQATQDRTSVPDVLRRAFAQSQRFATFLQVRALKQPR